MSYIYAKEQEISTVNAKLLLYIKANLSFLLFCIQMTTVFHGLKLNTEQQIFC